MRHPAGGLRGRGDEPGRPGHGHRPDLARPHRVRRGQLLDIDHVKGLNDTHGHQVGDDVLRQVAAVLRASSRDYDVVARYGGDEFGTSQPAPDGARHSPLTGDRRDRRRSGGYRRVMLRLARSPRWLGGLLFALVAAAACSALGRWQWDVSQSSHGDLQNLAYAFNWWLFAALCLWFWGKALRDESRRRPEQEALLAVGRRREPRPVFTAVEDPEVDEWNAWLAELGSRSRP